MAPPTRSPAGAVAVLAPLRRGRRKARGSPPGRPPRDGGGHGDGGGDGEGYSAPRPEGAGAFALGLALTGITTLFLVLIAVWLFLQRPAPDWRAAGAAGATDGLWFSTTCLLASSLAIEVAARRARRGEERRSTLRWLAGSVALGFAFLLAQAQLWAALWRAGLVPANSGYAAVFFALTGLHALHVLGGLGFLGVLIRSLWRDPRRAPSVRLGAIYWHFMGAIWLVLFTLLYFVR